MADIDTQLPHASVMLTIPSFITVSYSSFCHNLIAGVECVLHVVIFCFKQKGTWGYLKFVLWQCDCVCVCVYVCVCVCVCVCACRCVWMYVHAWMGREKSLCTV